MKTQTAAAETGAAPGRKFPWQCPCIRCGESAVVMGLWEPDGDSPTYHCNECEADFQEEDVRALVNGWAAFLGALDAARTFELAAGK